MHLDNEMDLKVENELLTLRTKVGLRTSFKTHSRSSQVRMTAPMQDASGAVPTDLQLAGPDYRNKNLEIWGS